MIVKSLRYLKNMCQSIVVDGDYLVIVVICIFLYNIFNFLIFSIVHYNVDIFAIIAKKRSTNFPIANVAAHHYHALLAV